MGHHVPTDDQSLRQLRDTRNDRANDRTWVDPRVNRSGDRDIRWLGTAGPREFSDGPAPDDRAVRPLANLQPELSVPVTGGDEELLVGIRLVHERGRIEEAGSDGLQICG